MNKEVLWIRTEATDSQIEGILNQRNRLLEENKSLREVIVLLIKGLHLTDEDKSK